VRFKGSRVIFSAGMARSGSTLLFNLLRLSLEAVKQDYSSGWIGDYSKIEPKQNVLIKTHELNQRRIELSDYTAYSYRDIRESLVSWKQKNKSEPPIHLAQFWLDQYRIAKDSANYIVSYENLTQKREQVLLQIAADLQLDIDTDVVLEQIPNASDASQKSSGFSSETLLHHNHFTGTKPNQWKTDLSEEMISFLKENCQWWFKDTGYEW